MPKEVCCFFHGISLIEANDAGGPNELEVDYQICFYCDAGGSKSKPKECPGIYYPIEITIKDKPPTSGSSKSS